MSQQNITHLMLIFAFISFACETTWGCPLCATSTAEEVRKGLNFTFRNETIWLALLLPFFVIYGVLQIINRFADHDDIRKDGEKGEPKY